MSMWNYGWHMGMGGMWFGWLILLVVIAFAIWALTAATSARVPLGGPGGQSDPETVLKGRYARGDIDRDEYQRRLEDLRK